MSASYGAVSFSLGRKETERASLYASTGFFLALACGTVLCTVGLWQITGLMRLLGSTDSILPYAKDYGRYILLASPLMAAIRENTLPQILKNGLPSLMRQGLMSVSSMLFNHRAALYGDAAVAAVSNVMRINAFLLSLIIGIGQGMQPVTGFNRAAGHNRRVKQAFAFTVLLGECIVSVLALVCFFGSDRILACFTPEESVLKIARPMLKLQSAALLLAPLTVYANQLLQSVGESWYATCLSALRSGLCLIPVLLVLSSAWGILGLQIAQPISDGITFLISMPILRAFFCRMARESKESSGAKTPEAP